MKIARIVKFGGQMSEVGSYVQSELKIEQRPSSAVGVEPSKLFFFFQCCLHCWKF